MQGSDQTLIIFIVVSLLIMGMMLYALVSVFMRFRRMSKQETPSQVGFVMETFQDLMSQLKEKELELESLHRRAEERADTMEDYNENILQSVPSGVVSMDTGWKVVKINASACGILGLDSQEITGRDGREIFGDIIKLASLPQTEFPQGSPSQTGLSKASQSQGGQTQTGLPYMGEAQASLPGIQLTGQSQAGLAGRDELRYKAPSGRELWIGYNLSPLRDAAGAEIGWLLVFTDLTQLKALEEQAALRRNLSSLGEMAAGIAHELRNPLCVISGYTRILRKKVDETSMATVDAVSSEVDAMEKIISDFLSFARPRKVEYATVYLRELMHSCLEKILSSTGKPPSVRINIDSGISLRADEVMLNQVFRNIIQNAMDATPPEGSITIEAYIMGEDVVISIADTGYGIDAESMDRIFNPFFTTKDKGTGLGLALVHRIITSHSGTISLDATESGTNFTITLPKSPDQPA